jgi:acid phosphatase (class A)
MMGKVRAVSVAIVLMLFGRAAAAAELTNRVVPENIIPPPPARGSAIEQNEIAEILKIRAAATPAALVWARHDNDIENASIFLPVLGPGWDLSKLPKTKAVVEMIMKVDSQESSAAKRYFHRSRPWIVDSRVQTCAEHEPGPAPNSYPSGHAMLGYELGVVFASLMPNHAQAILARAEQYGENRILCGFHFRSDVTAGQQYGSVLAIEMMQDATFHGLFLQAQSELTAAGLSR